MPHPLLQKPRGGQRGQDACKPERGSAATTTTAASGCAYAGFCGDEGIHTEATWIAFHAAADMPTIYVTETGAVARVTKIFRSITTAGLPTELRGL